MAFDLEEFLSTARDRFEFGRTADAYDREQAEADNAFANADNKDLGQWDKAALKARKKRPVLQWNRIPTFTAQVVNDGRQNKPSIRISPDDGGSPETAEYIQSRIRHIEYEANADTAKDTAREQQVTSGRGFIRVRTERVPGTDRQRIRIDRIENQFSVVFDPAAQEYDRSDAEWCFVISQISKDAHKRKYGEDSTVNRLDFADAIKLAPDWIGIGDKGEMIQIAEYYVREFDAAGECTAVKCYIINGAEILKEYEWIGSTIPIVPVWGREAVVDGKRRTYSLVRNAVGPQKLLNLYVSNAAEIIGQMPKSPHMVPVGGIPSAAEQDWAKVNQEALAYLLYNQYDEQGRPINPPNRITAEPPVQALAIGINQCVDAIKASMGIFDASIGAQSNETSGIAIQRRKQQTSITNYHFPDNEARSNKYLGEILVEILPKIDQPGAQYPTRSEEGKTRLVPVGIPHPDPKTGKQVVHDLMSGQYNVTVSTGPSYQSQRQEAYDRDAALVQANPELIWVIGAQMFRNDDTAGAEERAEAIEAYRDAKFPGVFPKKDEQGQQVPPEAQQAISQLQQKLQTTEAFAQSLHEQIATKQPELQTQILLKKMDLDFKREELAEKSRVELAKLGSAEDIVRLEAEIEVLKHQAGLAAQQQTQQTEHEHKENVVEMQQAHQASMADKQQAAAEQSQASEHDHQMTMAEKAAQQAKEAQKEGAEK